jgi:hypothetical protein
MNPGTCQVPDKMSGNMMPLTGKKPGMRPAPPGICVRYGRHSRIFSMMFHSNLLNLLAVWRFLPPWKRLERSLSSGIHRTGNSLKVSAAADVNLKPALLTS